MVPTLRHGDVVIARTVRRDVLRGGVRAGDVVIGRYRSMPDRLVVKTVAVADGDAWRLASDNPAAGGDSSVHGVADVLARVLLRLRAGARPQLIRRGPP
jgi:phage repressor protein C with HTH and peptisase S24 domain